MKESNLIKLKILEYSECDNRLFRINCGMGWTGNNINFNRASYTCTISNPRPFHGAPTGFPDTFGWTRKTITPEMVGQEVAIFTALEFKTKKYKRVTPEQKSFIDLINDSGGIANIIRE